MKHKTLKLISLLLLISSLTIISSAKTPKQLVGKTYVGAIVVTKKTKVQKEITEQVQVEVKKQKEKKEKESYFGWFINKAKSLVTATSEQVKKFVTRTQSKLVDEEQVEYRGLYFKIEFRDSFMDRMNPWRKGPHAAFTVIGKTGLAKKETRVYSPIGVNEKGDYYYIDIYQPQAKYNKKTFKEPAKFQRAFTMKVKKEDVKKNTFSVDIGSQYVDKSDKITQENQLKAGGLLDGVDVFYVELFDKKKAKKGALKDLLDKIKGIE